MSVDTAGDIERIVAHRYDLGGDHWTTPDLRLTKGAPFSTLECVDYLLDLGADTALPVLAESIELVLSTQRGDGRFRLAPGAILPCQTAWAAKVLCRAGLARDERLRATLDQLAQARWGDGGWRCSKFSYGRGPETETSNPHPTLMALDAFRHTDRATSDPTLGQAVEFLLSHWETRAPTGPCHYGIGTLFMQVEYPFRTYNLFYWLYVLSFYPAARRDPRFLQALNALEATMVDGQIVVQRVVPKLAGLDFCRKGKPSTLATARYQEIQDNVSTPT